MHTCTFNNQAPGYECYVKLPPREGVPKKVAAIIQYLLISAARYSRWKNTCIFYKYSSGRFVVEIDQTKSSTDYNLFIKNIVFSTTFMILQIACLTNNILVNVNIKCIYFSKLLYLFYEQHIKLLDFRRSL